MSKSPFSPINVSITLHILILMNPSLGRACPSSISIFFLVHKSIKTQPSRQKRSPLQKGKWKETACFFDSWKPHKFSSHSHLYTIMQWRLSHAFHNFTLQKSIIICLILAFGTYKTDIQALNKVRGPQAKLSQACKEGMRTNSRIWSNLIMTRININLKQFVSLCLFIILSFLSMTPLFSMDSKHAKHKQYYLTSTIPIYINIITNNSSTRHVHGIISLTLQLK